MPCQRFMPLVAAAALLATGLVRAESTVPPPPCTGGDYRAFDFQLGDWTLTDSAGQPGGRIRNTSILGGCAIAEDYVDVATGSRGVSTSAWDRERKAWQQYWVSSAGTTLLLRDGRRDGDRFVMHGRLPHPQTGRPQRQRVTWFIGGDGKVARQLWEQSDDDGATWAAHFDARYRPTPAP